MTVASQQELARFAQGFARTVPSADCLTNVKRFVKKINPQIARQTLDADVADVKVDGSTATVTMANGGPGQPRPGEGGDGKRRIDEAVRHRWRPIVGPNHAPG